jgi:hypothetical protein
MASCLSPLKRSDSAGGIASNRLDDGNGALTVIKEKEDRDQDSHSADDIENTIHYALPPKKGIFAKTSGWKITCPSSNKDNSMKAIFPPMTDPMIKIHNRKPMIFGVSV